MKPPKKTFGIGLLVLLTYVDFRASTKTTANKNTEVPLPTNTWQMSEKRFTLCLKELDKFDTVFLHQTFVCYGHYHIRHLSCKHVKVKESHSDVHFTCTLSGLHFDNKWRSLRKYSSTETLHISHACLTNASLQLQSMSLQEYDLLYMHSVLFPCMKWPFCSVSKDAYLHFSERTQEKENSSLKNLFHFTKNHDFPMNIQACRTCDLTNNSIIYVNKLFFSRNHNVRKLSLANNRLVELNFLIPKYLLELNLEFNQIERISNEAFTLAESLEILHLGNNRIKKIDAWNFPSSLRYLKLDHNEIGALGHVAFANLNLTSLDVSYNQMNYVDLETFKQSNIVEILLNHNHISNISSTSLGFLEKNDMLKRTEVFNVSHNAIQDAPLNLIFLSNMRFLDFSHNNVTKCSWAGTWAGIEDIEFRSKRQEWKMLFHELDHKTYPLDMYESKPYGIFLEFNQISLLSHIIRNPLMFTNSDFVFLNLTNIQNNNIKCDCHIYPYLKEIYDSVSHDYYQFHRDIYLLSAKFLEDVCGAKSVTLSSKQIRNYRSLLECPRDTVLRDLRHSLENVKCVEDVSPPGRRYGICHCILIPHTRTLILNCSKQNLFYFNDFTGLNNLECGPMVDQEYEFLMANKIAKAVNFIVILSGNFIKYMVSEERPTQIKRSYYESRGSGPKFTKLDLSNVTLSVLGEHYLYDNEFMQNVTELHLNDNNITHFPVKYEWNVDVGRKVIWPKWNGLKELHLYNNPFECTQTNAWILEWLRELQAKHILINSEEIRCGSVDCNQGRSILTMEPIDFKFCGWKVKVFEFFIVLALITLKDILFFVRFEIFKLLRWRFPWEKDECLGENMQYDAFILCYQEVDRELLIELKQHEQFSQKYKTCDLDTCELFPFGRNESEGLEKAVKESKRTIIILTDSYILLPESLKFYFKLAVQYWNQKDKMHRIIIWKKRGIKLDTVFEGYSFLLEKAICINFEDPSKWHKLLYAMP